jgi:hypothetical protein
MEVCAMTCSNSPARETPKASRGRSAGATVIRYGKDGLQVVRSSGARWTDAAAAQFLDRLAASCNVMLSADAAGFCVETVYKHRRENPVFAQRWQAALEQGYARIEMALVRRAADAMEGLAPDPATPIPEMTVDQALKVLSRHRATVEGRGRGRRGWTRPRSLDEVSESILTKLEAIGAAVQHGSPKPRDSTELGGPAAPGEP